MKRQISVVLLTATAMGHALGAPSGGELLREADRQALDPDASPIRRIERGAPRQRDETVPDVGFRRFDGRENNLALPEMGSAGAHLNRWAEADYGDGVSSPAGQNRPPVREISNIVADQAEDLPNAIGASDFLWQWGQFLDHDIDLTDGMDPPEPWPIEVPAGDSWFDLSATGAVEMAFNRSLYDPETGVYSVRQQINEITAWIDASNVYGSDEARAEALRELDGSGRLKTSEGDLLPFNTDGLSNAGGHSEILFVAGDPRANEQIGLTVLHTLFVREHNRLAAQIRQQNPELFGDEIYQRARRLVGAMMQAITYREYLPLLLGPRALPPYRGYDPAIDAGIANVFSSASYRYGHSALSSTLLRLDANGDVVPEGNLALRDAFFRPDRIAEVGGIAPYLRGLAAQQCQEIDPYIIDDVRNFLFGEPGEGGFDLASINLQRGRDHGLPSYNDLRESMGLEPAIDFAQISSDAEIQRRLAAAYQDVDRIDPWLGGLAEDAYRGGMVGELVHRVLRAQFFALRDGDRYWYQRSLSPSELQLVEDSRLVDIIRRNTTIGDEIADDVFHVSNSRPFAESGQRGTGRRRNR